MARNVRTAFAVVLALCMASPQAAEPGASHTAWRLAPQAALLPGFGGDSETVDYRLWLGRGRASFGVGLAAPRALGPWRDRGLSSRVVGLRYHINERSRLLLDSASFGDERPRDLRMGFEVEPGFGRAHRSLVRLQWSSTQQLSLRVRRGGLMLALRTQFY